MIPLAGFPALRSRDPDEAFASILTRQPGVYSFEPIKSPNRRWGIDVNFLALRRIGITSTRSSAYSMNSGPDGFARVFVPFGTPFRAQFKSGSRDFLTGVPGLLPLEDYRAHFQAGFGTLLATIPLTLLEEVTLRLGATQSIKLLLAGANGHSSALDIFSAHLSFVIRSYDDHPLVLDEARFKALHEELLVLHLADALVRFHAVERKAVNSPVLRRAIEFVMGRLTDDFRISDIADHAGCGVRSLQTAFQTEFQMTVSAFIRSERLKLARRTLQNPNETATVISIALASGFNHLGDFARYYREAYGERPSTTLQQARRTNPRA